MKAWPILAILLIPSFAQAQLTSGVLPSPQAINWQNAGVQGGIPTNYTQCGSTVAAGASAATVNNDLITCSGTPPCSPGKYVLLGAGSFSFSTGIAWDEISCVELRGSGSNSTFVTFSAANGCQGTAAYFCINGSITYNGSQENSVNWTAGYAQGATTISLASVPNLSIGMYIILDQTDDVTDSGDVWICQSTGATCSLGGTGGGTRESPNGPRSQEQQVVVTQCDGNSTFGHTCSSGANITISAGLYMPNWLSTRNPQAWWGTYEAYGDGVSNLSANCSGGAGNCVEYFDAMNSWSQNMRTIGNTSRAHHFMFQADHITVQNDYMFLQGPSASVNYGMAPFPCGDCLMQNNICEQIQACYPDDAPASGSVFSYNFDVNNYFSSATFLNQSGFPHSEGDDHLLYEGNIGAGVYSDNFHGSHNFQTIFRNYWNGYQENNGTVTSGNTVPLILDAFSRFYSVIGNVLGSRQLCASGCAYAWTTSFSTALNTMYVIGIGNGVNNDSNTLRTIFRWGNYDVVTGATRWCGNSSDTGWSTTCGSTTEVPSGITNYATPIPTLGDTGAGMGALPASFYLSSQPNWWTSGIPWPSIGPDVSGGNVLNCSNNNGVYALTNSQCSSFGGSSSNGTAGHVTANPAMACYYNVMGGSPNGTDSSALAFNPSACYASTTTTPPGPPNPLMVKIVKMEETCNASRYCLP